MIKRISLLVTVLLAGMAMTASAGHLRSDGFGGYYDSDGGHYRSDGFGGFYDPDGNHVRSDGFGGYFY